MLIISPLDITLTVDSKKNVVQPDFGIICNMDKNLDEMDRYMGVPTMVAEVLSEGSISKDMVRKLQIYKKGEGIRSIHFEELVVEW